MDATWVALLIGVFSGLNGWAQFYIKERIFSKVDAGTDKVLAIFKTGAGIVFIAATGMTSVASGIFLAMLTTSAEPLTRIACFQISAFTALMFLNFMLVHSLFTLRKFASIAQDIKAAERRAAGRAYFMSQS
nr:hypothetical protein [uncultured Duganella sp.]